MKFQIVVTPSADGDLKFFKVPEQRTIVKAIALYLSADANIQSRRRKLLRPNPIAPWELRIDRYRVFYCLEAEATVKIVAIGFKDRNDLYIRGEKIEL